MPRLSSRPLWPEASLPGSITDRLTGGSAEFCCWRLVVALVEVVFFNVAVGVVGAARIEEISAPAEFSVVGWESDADPASLPEQLESNTAALRTARRRRVPPREAVVGRDIERLSVARTEYKQAVHS